MVEKISRDMAMECKMVFIVGTGRCGTKSLAHILNNVPGVQVEHEIDPPLLDEVDGYLKGKIGKEKLIDILRTTRKPKTKGLKVFGESNQRLSFIIPELMEAFPGAKFIWIIRDGREVVSSTTFRGWYGYPIIKTLKSEKWEPYRIGGDFVGDIISDEWNKMKPFAKNCWYWSYTNKIIDNQRKNDKEDFLFVKIEEMNGCLDKIKEFIGIPKKLGLENRIVNAAKKRYLFNGGPLKFDMWTKRERMVFEFYAGEIMDYHYPSWREKKKFKNDVFIKIKRAKRWVYFNAYSLIVPGTRSVRKKIGLTKG